APDPCHNQPELARTGQHAPTQIMPLNWAFAISALARGPTRTDSQAEYGGSIPLIRSLRMTRRTAWPSAVFAIAERPVAAAAHTRRVPTTCRDDGAAGATGEASAPVGTIRRLP